MKRYKEYKDSGVRWIGEVPSHWIIKKLKYSCQMFGRIGFRGYSQTDLVHEGEGAITLSPTNMNSMFVDYSKCTYLSWKKYFESPEIMVNPGDVLLVKTASVGKCSYVNELPQECTVNPQILVLKEHKDSPLFLTYLFQTAIGQTYIELNKVGSTIPTLSEDKIGKFSFAFPPISEQLSIVSFLNSKTKLIDDIIAKREKQIELLEEMKSAIISRAVTKGLNPGAKMKDSGIEWIGEIPERWEMCKLKYILKSEKYNIKTGPFGTQLKGNDLREEGDVPVYNQRNVIDNQFHSPSVFVTLDKANELAGFHTKPYDVLITSRGTIGKAAILPNGAKEGILHPCLIALRINQDLVNLKYLLYYINGFEGFAINVFLESNATTIEVIYTDTLKNIFVTLPQLKEQEAIASYLDSETSKIDTRIAKRRKQIELLQEYKQALITAAVTGKIDVREYNS